MPSSDIAIRSPAVSSMSISRGSGTSAIPSAIDERPDQELPDQEFPDHEMPLQEAPDHDRPLHERPDQELPDQEFPDHDFPFQIPPDHDLPWASKTAMAAGSNGEPMMSSSPVRRT